MRLFDRPIPPFTPHPLEGPPSDWPAQPHLVIEGQARPPYVWDDLRRVWDEVRNDHDAVWDPPWESDTYTDVACDLAGVDWEHGPPDSIDLYPTGSLRASLVDTDGRYSEYTPRGELTNFQVGQRIFLLAFYAGEWWWLWSGRITKWDAWTTPGMVDVEAFTSMSVLAQARPGYVAGTGGEQVPARIRAILASTYPTMPFRTTAGTVALTAQATTKSPLEEIQTTALSDGGVVFGDSDDELQYFNRDWWKGRADQTITWTYTDNGCDETIVHEDVWNAVLSNNDDELTTEVQLNNVAGLVADKQLAGANPYAYEYGLTHLTPLSHPNPDYWTTQAEGDDLAQHYLDRRDDVSVKVESFQLYVTDRRRNLWRQAVDTRLTDRCRFLHRYRTHARAPGSTALFDLGLCIISIAGSITPTQWVMTFGTTRGLDYRDNTITDPSQFPIEALYDYTWDSGRDWDDPTIEWDHPPILTV